MNCDNAQALSIYGNFCHDSNDCPTESFSSFAMSSNCSKINNHFCPLNFGSSKICIDKANVPITEYCPSGLGLKNWECPKANKGLNFDQCYDM